MVTAMLTAKNILSGMQTCDTWKVNQDVQYQEEKLINLVRHCTHGGGWWTNCSGNLLFTQRFAAQPARAHVGEELRGGGEIQPVAKASVHAFEPESAAQDEQGRCLSGLGVPTPRVRAGQASIGRP